MSGATAVAIGTAVAGAAASAVISRALAPKAKGQTAAPALEAAKPLPTVDDSAALNARRKTNAAAAVRGGRASTILSETDSNTLGG